MCKKIYFPFTLGLTSHQKTFVPDRTAVSTLYRSEWHSSFSEVPSETWQSISNDANQYFDPVYLQSLEITNSDRIDFHYLIIYKGMQPVAQATVQVLDLHIPEISSEGAKPGLMSQVGGKLIEYGRRKPLRLMVCGNVFVTGETSYRVKEGEDLHEVMKQMSEAFTSLRKEISSEKKVGAFLFKDYPKNTKTPSEMLTNYGFHSFQVEPNMVLDLHPDWKTFEDYTGSMVAKFRTKAKSAYKKSKDLVQKDLDLEELKEHLVEMDVLYRSVARRADFNMSLMNLEVYLQLKEKMGDKFKVRTYWLEDKMVAFMTAMLNGKTLDAHFVGFEYDLNRKYQLYSRILYDYVRIGLDFGAELINFGRTSNEIKSTLGALPVPLTCYARHRNSIANQLVMPIFRLIGPKDWEQRKPFKKEFYEAQEVH